MHAKFSLIFSRDWRNPDEPCFRWGWWFWLGKASRIKRRRFHSWGHQNRHHKNCIATNLHYSPTNRFHYLRTYIHIVSLFLTCCRLQWILLQVILLVILYLFYKSLNLLSSVILLTSLRFNFFFQRTRKFFFKAGIFSFSGYV